MEDWLPVGAGEEVLPGWEPWNVEVRLGTLPDGTVAPIGLRVEPRDDYEGSLRDQRITLERLRQFPIGLAAAQGKYLAARIRRPEPIGPEVSEGDLPTLEEIAEHLRRGGQVAGTREGWERVALLAESIVARFEAHQELSAIRRAEARSEIDARVREIYREGGWSERDINLQRASDYYKESLRDPDVVSPRKYVAEAMDVSLTSVDRYLRQAREEGYLPPYDGPQGKHGKPGGPAHD